MEVRRGETDFSRLQAGAWRLTRELESRYMETGAFLLVPVKLLMTDAQIQARFGFPLQVLEKMGAGQDVFVLAPAKRRWAVSIMPAQDIGRGSGRTSQIRRAYLDMIRQVKLEMIKHEPDPDTEILSRIAASLFELLPSGPGSTQEELRAEGMAPETALSVLEE